MAACRLASKGKTMADSTYESEVNALKTFLSMQQPATGNSTDNCVSRDILVENYVAPRFAKKLKSSQVSVAFLKNFSYLSLFQYSPASIGED